MAMVAGIVVTRDAKRPAHVTLLKNGVSMRDIVMMLKPYR